MPYSAIRVARVIVLFALLTGGPLALLAYFSLTLGQEVVREEVEGTLDSTVAATGAFIEQHLMALKAIAESYASRPVLRRSTLRNAAGMRDLPALQLHLEQLQRSNAGIAAAFVTELDATMIAIAPVTPEIVGKKFNLRDWYTGVNAKKMSYVSEVYISRATGHPRVVGVATFVPHPDGITPIAVLVIAYQTCAIQEFVDEFFHEQAVTMTVTDQRGVAVATPNRQELLGLRRLNDVHVAAALLGKKGVDGTSDPQNVIAFTPVRGLGWTVVGAKSTALAYARSSRMKTTILSLTGLLGVVLLAALTYLARTLLRRVAVERDLFQARDAAMAASRSKSSFLANMSHEIRTPLNGVIGMTGLLLTTPLNDVQSEYAMLAKRSGESLLQLINDLLDISKIEAGKLEVECVCFCLPALITSVAQMFEPQAIDKKLCYTFDLANDLPPLVLGDPGRLRQILINVLNNAVKFTAQGSITMTAHSETTDGQTYIVKMCIADTGVGINDAAQRTLFKPFEQADASTTRRYGGTGLGLAICRQLIELMNGTIRLESKHGQGSKFYLTLPFQRTDTAHSIDDDHSDHDHDHVASGVPAPQQRILVVDDNAVNLKVVVGLLTKKGYTVDVAENGEDAIAQVLARPYAAVLMDCHMPVLDGYEATSKIRAMQGYTLLPIIALTASAMQEDQRRCRAAGMNDFIAKPIAADALYATLHRWGVNRVSDLDRS